MRNFLRKIWEDKRGNSLIIAAAALPLLLGSAGLATDTIQWALWKRQLQRATDSAAIAGVYDRVAHDGATDATGTAVSHDLTLNNHTDIPLVSGYPQVSYPADDGDKKYQVKVQLAIQRRLSFSSLFMANPPLIKTSATAATVPGTDEYCVVSLQNNSKTGIQGSGNARVIMDCGMITNSIATDAAAAQGSAYIQATVIAAAGSIQQSSNWHVNKYDPFAPALDDPYEDLTPDSDDWSKCGSPPPSLTVNNTNDGMVVDGGACYSSLSVGSNRTLTLKNGVYFIDGGSVNIQGTLNMVNATLVLSNKSSSSTAPIGSLDANASGQINITAPTEGKWKGMAIYQDRRATDSAPTGNISASSPNKINGNTGSKIIGAIYFPNQQVTYNGDGTAGWQCTQLVVKRVVFTGNNNSNNFTSDCDMYGIEKIGGGVLVRLVA